jgi:hypothetical protein
MCIMSLAAAKAAEDRKGRRAEISVSSTRLFARLDGGEQYLAYQMAIDAPAELVMVLPLPVAKIAEDAIEFIDLSAIPKLFDRLNACFEPPPTLGRSRSVAHVVPQSLKVHRIGSFEASWVPTLADMNRLDPRFRLDDQVWRELPQFADYGFAVFQLQPGAHTIHPMAMKFPTREAGTLFFPTVHVHDGTVHREADFDHELYFQAPSGPRADLPAGPAALVRTAYTRPEDKLDIEHTRGVITRNMELHRVALRGSRANADTRIEL